MTAAAQSLAVACAAAALDGDERTLCRLLALADEPGDAVWFRDGDEPVNDDDVFLPIGEEIPDEPELPVAEELTPTEQAVFNNHVVHAASSWIEEWHYDGPNAVLYILAKGPKKRNYVGKEYPLGRVPFRVAMDFYRSDSPGRFFNRFLKGKYPSGGSIGYKPTNPGPNVVMTVD